MPLQVPQSHPLLEAGIARRCLGPSRHAGTGYRRRSGEIWVVFHGDWTGVHRLDPRDGRTIHFELGLDGDRRAEAVRWAVETFGLDETNAGDRETGVADMRLHAAANRDARSDIARRA